MLLNDVKEGGLGLRFSEPEWAATALLVGCRHPHPGFRAVLSSDVSVASLLVLLLLPRILLSAIPRGLHRLLSLPAAWLGLPSSFSPEGLFVARKMLWPVGP